LALTFVPAMVVTEPVALTSAAPENGRMVIEIGKDRRVIVDAGVDAAALARVLAILERR
jgi:transposase